MEFLSEDRKHLIGGKVLPVEFLSEDRKHLIGGKVLPVEFLSEDRKHLNRAQHQTVININNKGSADTRV